jgi:hypothetical protein
MDDPYPLLTVMPEVPMMPLAERAAEQIDFAMATLSRVDKVEIHQRLERHGRGSYVVDVFLRPDTRQQDRMARANSKDRVFQRGEPPQVSDYQVDHGYSEFTRLRQLVGFFASLHGDTRRSSFTRRSSGFDRCGYCTRLTVYLKGDWWLPGTGMRLTTTKSVKMRTLTTFINRLLALTVSSEALESASSSCRACVHVPLVLEEFLRRSRGDSLGII